MIGIDRNTGRTLIGWEQLVSRVQQVMTTRIGAREKRRGFGSRVPETLGRNMGDHQLMLAQSYAIDAFYNPANGVSDFQPTRCIASRHEGGIRLHFEGLWAGQRRTFEVSV